MLSILPPQSASRPRLTTALITQLSIGPAFREVAASLLREQLQAYYPALDIDPNIAMVGTPTWEVVEDVVVARPADYRSLTDILARQAVLAVPSLFIEGEHFLTQQPISEPAMHLPVRMEEIAHLINVLAPVMIRGYQEQQLAFWNQPQGTSGPHWHELSEVLRSLWNVDQAPGWTEEDCLMARQLFMAPDVFDRRLNDRFGTRAYVIDIDQIDADSHVIHLNEHVVTVLIGKQEDREVILVYSLLQGYRKYPTLEELGQDLALLVDTAISHGEIQWRLLEPQGNFFDHLACTLITIQLDAIGAIDFTDLGSDGASPSYLAIPSTTRGNDKHANPHLEWLQQALPAWLSGASVSDMTLYSRYMKDLAALHIANQGRSYQDGIAPIEQYARERLKAEMLIDHVDAEPLKLDDIELVIRSPVIWGMFAVPGKTETQTFTLAELALQNLIALPVGIKALRHRGSQPMPDWLTVSYLESLVTHIDIGSRYPALIKSTLLDDPREAARRQQLFSEHLRIQLPMLALQYKIRQEAGLDERGYRYVAALMQPEAANRQVDGKPIVLRQLAFIPTRRFDRRADAVDNMFVIGPQNLADGPCLLYSPLLAMPLTQFPSPTNLLYAISQSTHLREAVLAWLPDNARSDYRQYVFPGSLPSPWTVMEFVVDPIKLVTLSGPLTLSENIETGDLFSTLFNANANALITLADRQSVSNVEARWATFKRIGWAIFNGVLPFLGRTVAAAAWVWQLMDQLQEVIDARDASDRPAPWAALADLLLNLGMAIALHAVARLSPRQNLEAARPGKPAVEPGIPLAPSTLVVRKLPTLSTEALASSHSRTLHISGAINSTPLRLGTVLDSFKREKPATLDKPISVDGPYQHLYAGGDHYYAPVGTRWFEVKVDENDQVIIVDPVNPERTGPPLIHNHEGAWFVDTRLRLRGGGPKALIKKAKTLAQKRAEELRTQLSEFESRKKDAQEQLQNARQAMEAAPSTSAQARRQTYLRTLDSQCAEYESALQKLKGLAIYAPTPDYPQKALNYLKAQTELTSAGIREALTRFTPELRGVLDKIERQAESPQERYIDEARRMAELNREMLTYLDYMQTRFNELQKLAKEGARLIRKTKSALPIFTAEDLKALQVTMGRNLCLPAATTLTEPLAWQTIDQIVDRADLAIQCLHETLLERSESRIDERIDTLSNLVEQLQLLDERLQDFSAEFAEHVIKDDTQALQDQLSEFRRRAVSHLGLLSTERQVLRSRATPPPTPPRPQKKFIRTRYHGLLIGEPRVSDVGLETGLVDIRSPLTQKVIATFHEKPPGVWVERVKTPPSTPAEHLDISAQINQGRALLDGLPAFIQRAERYTQQADRSPGGVEFLYHQQAKQLEQISHAIAHTLNQVTLTEGVSQAARTLSKSLETAAADVYRQSNQQVLTALKKHPPTVPALEWLKTHNAVSIKKTVTRRRLKSATPDYLDEYTITDRQTQQVLWYAHFHYSTSWTPAKVYLSARLKTVEEHRLGAVADSTQHLNEAQKTAFYRSEISLEPARQLFFDRPKSESERSSSSGM